MKERLMLVKKKLINALKVIWVFIVGALLIIFFPLWGLYWLITGWDFGRWSYKFIDPDGYKKTEEQIAIIEDSYEVVIEFLQWYNKNK